MLQANWIALGSRVPDENVSEGVEERDVRGAGLDLTDGHGVARRQFLPSTWAAVTFPQSRRWWRSTR
jgi:hypothetical protein